MVSARTTDGIRSIGETETGLVTQSRAVGSATFVFYTLAAVGTGSRF
jgi:hypothetical protein